MVEAKASIAPPDPALPDFGAWVRQTLVGNNRLPAVLAAVRYALGAYPFSKALVPSVWGCVSDLQRASRAVPGTLGSGVRASILQDAIRELETIRDAVAVHPRNADAAEGIALALMHASMVVGVRSEEVVPKDIERQRKLKTAANGRRGGRRRAVRLKGDADDWRARAKDYQKTNPALSRREVAERIRRDIETTDPRAYEGMFRTAAERAAVEPDSVRDYAHTLEQRAVNRIYKHIGPVFPTRRTLTLKRARRPS